MNHTKIELEFREALDETDYGLIIGANGELKGIWVPNGSHDRAIPQGIVNMCQQQFGIDPNNESHYSVLQ